MKSLRFIMSDNKTFVQKAVAIAIVAKIILHIQFVRMKGLRLFSFQVRGVKNKDNEADAPQKAQTSGGQGVLVETNQK